MFNFLKSQAPKSTVVTFTGGMGAQMISAAIYFQMQSEGKKVYADLSYFEQPKELAIEGHQGQVSHWGWQLHPFSLQKESFTSIKSSSSKKYQIIEDGAVKLRLGLAALKYQNIKDIFPLRQLNVSRFLGQEEVNYLCIHMRRGDYLNVSSYLVSDASFIRLAERFSKLMNRVVVVSDSAIPENVKTSLSALFTQTYFLDTIDEYQSHHIMRQAAVLLCSNSQFSLIAAMLNTNGLILLPRAWFGLDQSELEAIVSNLGDFQVLS